MKYFSLVLLPDGTVESEKWIEPPVVPLPGVGSQGKFEVPVTLSSTMATLDGTARGGRVMMSIWRDDRMVTSNVVVSGAEKEQDERLLQMFYDSSVKTTLVKELTAGREDPLSLMFMRRERPLAVTILLPTESVPETEAILDLQLRWISAHLSTVLAS